MSGIAILGAGLTGLSAAYHLQSGYTLFEREKEVGGVCRSFTRSGYTFDATGHVLHFRTPEMADFIGRLLRWEWSQSQRSAWVYTREKYIPYPFQTYFTQLSDPVREECLAGFLKAHQSPLHEAPKTFEEWILSRFGAGIAKHFLIPYNTKLWRLPPSELGIDGVQKYIPIPTLDEILNNTPYSLGYNAQFYYPRQGGIHRVALALQEQLRRPVQLQHDVEWVDLDRRTIRFANGREFQYDQLLSTIPLPELMNRIRPMPEEIRQLSRQLQWVSLTSFHFGVRGLQEREKHWVYFAEQEFPFYRVILPSNYALHLAPPGCGTLQVEVPYAVEKQTMPDLRSDVVRGLCRAGLFEHESQIEVEDAHTVRYGYAVFTPGCYQIVKTVTEFLEKESVFLAGRYATWEYMSLEDCILAGREAAELTALRSPLP